jgi:multidrug resistance efflux pump
LIDFDRGFERQIREIDIHDLQFPNELEAVIMKILQRHLPNNFARSGALAGRAGAKSAIRNPVAMRPNEIARRCRNQLRGGGEPSRNLNLRDRSFEDQIVHAAPSPVECEPMRISVRNLRIIAAVALTGAVIWATAPYATSYVSSQAVVNAPLNTVLSPMQGYIAQRSPAAGTGVAAGAPLVVTEVEERDHRYLEDLRARLVLLGENLASAEREAEAALTAAKAARVNAAATLLRAEALVRQGHATASRADADAAAHAEAVAEVSRLNARLERVGIELAAAEAGTFVQEGWNDVPYSQQRLDEIVLKLAALGTERQRNHAEHAAIERQISIEQQLIAQRETFSPVAPSAGVIWKQSGAVGETVVPGDILVQMVNCDARFVEVTLAERHFGDIAPGDTARVRLKGGGESVSARVTAVLGAGAKFDHPRLAASVVVPKPDQLRVLVSLQGTALDAGPGAFCHVGRTAEVRFERRDLSLMRGMAQSFGEQLLSLFADPGLAPALIDTAQSHQTAR